MPQSNSTSAGDWKSEYGFSPNYLEVQGGRIHYVDEGPAADDGEPVDPILMVHGNPTWSFYWRNLIRALSPRYRTIAIDHLGCGLSDTPTHYDYWLANHRDNLLTLVETLNLRRVTLMAHDWGGAIGMASLLKDSKRFKRIILFNTAAFPPPYIPFRIQVCRWPLVGQVGVQGLNMFAKAAITMATEQKGGLPKTVANGLLAPYSDWKSRTAIYQFVKDIPANPRHRTWQLLSEVEAELSSVAHLPILLCWGMKDWCFRPECLERFQQHWPNAFVHKIASAGHYVIEDAAEEVEQTVARFLFDNPI